MSAEPFLLDRVENPHPRMATRAIEYRTSYRLVADHAKENAGTASSAWWQAASAVAERWFTYLECMCDATGCEPAEVNEWLDRLEARPVERLPGL